MTIADLQPGIVVRGPLFPEPVQVIVTVPLGAAIKLIGKGLRTSQVYEPVLTTVQLAQLESSPQTEPFDANAGLFRLGIEALRLGLAYEHDPYFSLSIARVDPLPHQLEAVYEYFLKLPRIRFLLGDDPGAGKTIMAGLLLKELKIRGLVKRTLIVAPANLTFQWQRELKDKFREQFEVVRSDVLRANYGSNPWQDRAQVITSVSWVSRVEDAKASLLRSQWDLIIVDEAHKMSAASTDKKTLAYQLGEELGKRTDHYLLMTATPHKGDPANFCLFLELLDRDVYGDVKSLEEAMKRNSAPFYLRRPKEAMVTFPDPLTGVSHRIFTKRDVRTIPFQIDDDEFEFYDALTRYVENQSIKAATDDSARGRALGFTMAMLQRRFASSVYAARRSLERMRDKRVKILADPAAYQKQLIEAKLPDDFDELEDDEQQQILAALESVVASVDPAALQDEILALGKLIELAQQLEQREIETKLTKLREVLTANGVFADPKMKLLLFTEHKDTLDYLVAKLQAWGLTVTKIHGGMKIGDRDTAHTRIYAEREFRETAQVLVATEAAGEGINLQFCWFMVNYDIPWNPVRLEQRMGRIHRYGQEKDCLILNFVATNTVEGRVMTKLFERIQQIEADLDPQRTGKVFNVLGDVFPANQIERWLRDMYARSLTEDAIKSRIVQQVDTERFREITEAALEGLAKKTLNLSALIGKTAEARERRLVPEVIHDFFLQSAEVAGLALKPYRGKPGHYALGKVPRVLWPIGERLEPRCGQLGREYPQLVFDKQLLKADPTAEWVTPGHPLFESVREEVLVRTADHLQRGGVFHDLQSATPYTLDFFSAAVRDGAGHEFHRRLFVVQTAADGRQAVRQPTILLDLSLARPGTAVPASMALPARAASERFLVDDALQPFLAGITRERVHDTEVIVAHLKLSLNALIDRQNLRCAELHAQQGQTDNPNLLAANLKQVEDRLDELNGRLERRLAELDQERQCLIGDLQFIGRAIVLPHPDRATPAIAPMVTDPVIEQIAVQAAITHEQARGWQVESVETQNRGFDLISRRPHPEDPQTFIEVRFIEVKGRAASGPIALTANEYHTAARLKRDYWLYVVYQCATTPVVHPVQDPATLGWQPVKIIEQYQLPAAAILASARPSDQPPPGSS